MKNLVSQILVKMTLFSFFFFFPLGSQILYWQNFAYQLAKMSYLLNLVTYMTCNLVLTAKYDFMLSWTFHFWDKRFLSSQRRYVRHLHKTKQRTSDILGKWIFVSLQRAHFQLLFDTKLFIFLLRFEVWPFVYQTVGGFLGNVILRNCPLTLT